MWLSKNENNRNWAAKITKEESLPVLLEDYYAADEAKVWDKLINKIEATNEVRSSMPLVKLYKTYRIAVAAVILFVLSAGVYFYYSASTRQHTNRFADHDLGPGGNSATLTLSDGRKIKLSDGVKGELAQEVGIRITKTKDGQVVYTILAAPGEIASQARNGEASHDGVMAYNTLSTAKGETYQIVLPDKSVVWLNAASSLKYPASFANLKERKVVLDGEAYFEIAHNSKQPFRVQSTNQIIEDIGTAFNVNSYKDEAQTKTTLVEGSVKISVPARGIASQATNDVSREATSLRGGTLKQSTPQIENNIILKPGEQGISTGGAITINKADISQTIA